MLNDRFWTKVDKTGPNGCWVWLANKNNKGYGMFSISAVVGKKLAHRLSYEGAKGRIPKGRFVLHSCDNPACVNPDHLRIGNAKENVADMIERGRKVTTPMPGMLNSQSRLTDEQVIAIRLAYLAGERRETIAPRYDISVLSVSDIIGGKSWRHLFGVNGAPSLADLKAVAASNTKSAAKITLETAREIRQRLANGEMGKDLAVAYGIHKATISDIKLQKIWPD